MQTSWNLPQGASAHDVAHWILAAQNDSGELQNVVLDSHGSPGEIFVGGTDGRSIRRSNVGVFRHAKGRIKGTIWIIACEVVRGDAGTVFCSRLAKAADCNVVASTSSQYVETGSCPFGCVDNYESPAFRWDRNGNSSICHSDDAGIPGVAS